MAHNSPPATSQKYPVGILKGILRFFSLLLAWLGIYRGRAVYYIYRNDNTFTIIKYAFCSVLKIGNGLDIEVWGYGSGTITSSEEVYGYIVFNNGYFLLAELNSGHFWGYNKFDSSKKTIDTFCTYPPTSPRGVYWAELHQALLILNGK